MRTHILRSTSLLALLMLGFMIQGHAQSADLKSVCTGKWKVIWFADDGKEQNMEDKKQIMTLRSDGSGETQMLGQKVCDVKWEVVGKNTITFQDDPASPPYIVKVSKYKSGTNMLFTGRMPTGVQRKVYFQALSSR